ncbi:MAG TPA: hypothetical protein VMV18_14635 [bacterium]|nr:hypothetical protein [bacterium]
MRVRRGVQAIPPGAIGGGVAALVLLALAKCSLIPMWIAWSSPVAVLLGGAVTFFIAWSRAISNEEMAEILDLRFGHREKIVAGWEIAQRGAKTPIEEAAVAAAADAAARTEIKDAVPVRAPRGSGVSLASFVLPVLLALLLPAWMPDFVKRANVEKEQVKQAGKQLQKVAEQLATPTPTPSPGATPDKESGAKPDKTAAKPDKNDPVEKLKKLADKMQKGEIGKREAMKQLSELDKEIARNQAEQAKSEAGRSLARAASEMEKEETTKDLGKALSQGEAEQIRKEEKELEKKFDQKGTFEKKQQQSLADQLDKIADALEQGGDSQSAQEAREAAKALRKGDMQAAKDHLEKADLASSVAAQHEGDPVHKMAKELQQNSDTKQAGSSMDKGDGKQTAQEMEKLADRLEKGELGEKGEQELQKTMEKAAKEGQSQGENTPGGRLSKPMASAAKSLAKGNKSGAAEALRNMSRGMQGAAQTAQENADAREALEEAKQRLGGNPGAGQKVSKMDWHEPGDGKGQGDGKGDGKGEGEGDGKGDGKNGKQAARNGATATGSGQASTEAGFGTSKFEDKGYDATQGGPQHDRQAGKTGDWRKEYEQAYKAARTDKAKLSDSKISGQMTAGDTKSIEVDGKPPEKGSAKEQYVDVPAGYREAAEEAVGSEDIPPEHRERVKAYFESLSGNGDDKGPGAPAPQATSKDAPKK